MYADDAPVSDVLVHALGVRIVGGGGRDVGDWSLKVPGMVGVASGSGSDVVLTWKSRSSCSHLRDIVPDTQPHLSASIPVRSPAQQRVTSTHHVHLSLHQ